MLPDDRPENERRRTPEDADVRQTRCEERGPALVWMGVDPAHHVWPGGGEPHFPMQLCHVGYGHVATRHNLGGPDVSLWTPGGEHPVDRPGPAEGPARLGPAAEGLAPRT